MTLLPGALFLCRAAVKGRGRTGKAPTRDALAGIAGFGGLLAVTVVPINAAFLFVAVPYAIEADERGRPGRVRLRLRG